MVKDRVRDEERGTVGSLAAHHKVVKALGGHDGPAIQKFNRSKDAFAKRHPTLVSGVSAMKDAFGRYLELSAEEVAAIELIDVRCVKYRAGQEVPWHRDDPRSHFCVMVLLSDSLEQLDGGTLVLHGGECQSDDDAMPARLEQGDAVIYCCPRLDVAIRRVEAGERLMAVFEYAIPDGYAPRSRLDS